MCKYEVNVEMKYGKYNIPCESYNEAMVKYKEVKNELINIPAKITVWNCEKEIKQFSATTNPELEFKKLYNNLINTLIKINKISIELSEKENSYAKSKNSSYHMIEETDYEELDLDMLINLKKTLTERRIVKEENVQYFSFHECNVKIIELLSNFKNTRADKLHKNSNQLHRSKYYKESLNAKLKRITTLEDLKINL